jgi:hypothetical protein
MNYVIALDPGQSTGWAKYSIDGELLQFGTLQWETEFLDQLMEWTPAVMVAEDYIIRSGKAAGNFQHQWNRGVPLQVLGAVKFRARQVGCEIVLQQPSLKPGAYAHMGAEFVKGKKGMHYMDAIAHGHEFLLRNGMLKTHGV